MKTTKIDPKIQKQLDEKFGRAAEKSVQNVSPEDLDQQVFDELRRSKPRIKVIRSLIRQGATLKAKDQHGRRDVTALIYAVMRGHVEVVKLFLDGKRADIEAGDGDKDTALFYAVFNDQLEILKLLLDHGADIRACNVRGRTALHEAVFNMREEITEELVKRGAPIDLPDNEGETVLLRAMARSGNEKIIQFLVDYHADLSVKNKSNQNAAILAAKEGYAEVLERVFKNKILSPQEKDELGDTLLISAAEGGHYGCVQVLLKYGAHFDEANKAGETAMMKAAIKGHLEIVKLLAESDADFLLRNNDKKSALELAREMNHEEVVGYLEEQEQLMRALMHQRKVDKRIHANVVLQNSFQRGPVMTVTKQPRPGAGKVA